MMFLPANEGERDGYPAPMIPREGEWELYLAPILLVGIGTCFSYVLYLARGKSWDTGYARDGRVRQIGPGIGELGQSGPNPILIGPKLF